MEPTRKKLSLRSSFSTPFEASPAEKLSLSASGTPVVEVGSPLAGAIKAQHQRKGTVVTRYVVQHWEQLAINERQEDVKQMINTLNENFLTWDDVEKCKDFELAEWRKMGIPLGLKAVLMKGLESVRALGGLNEGTRSLETVKIGELDGATKRVEGGVKGLALAAKGKKLLLLDPKGVSDKKKDTQQKEHISLEADGAAVDKTLPKDIADRFREDMTKKSTPYLDIVISDGGPLTVKASGKKPTGKKENLDDNPHGNLKLHELNPPVYFSVKKKKEASAKKKTEKIPFDKSSTKAKTKTESDAELNPLTGLAHPNLFDLMKAFKKCEKSPKLPKPLITLEEKTGEIKVDVTALDLLKKTIKPENLPEIGVEAPLLEKEWATKLRPSNDRMVYLDWNKATLPTVMSQVVQLLTLRPGPKGGWQNGKAEALSKYKEGSISIGDFHQEVLDHVKAVMDAKGDEKRAKMYGNLYKWLTTDPLIEGFMKKKENKERKLMLLDYGLQYADEEYMKTSYESMGRDPPPPFPPEGDKMPYGGSKLGAIHKIKNMPKIGDLHNHSSANGCLKFWRALIKVEDEVERQLWGNADGLFLPFCKFEMRSHPEQLTVSYKVWDYRGAGGKPENLNMLTVREYIEKYFPATIAPKARLEKQFVEGFHAETVFNADEGFFMQLFRMRSWYLGPRSHGGEGPDLGGLPTTWDEEFESMFLIRGYLLERNSNHSFRLWNEIARWAVQSGVHYAEPAGGGGHVTSGWFAQFCHEWSEGKHLSLPGDDSKRVYPDYVTEHPGPEGPNNTWPQGGPDWNDTFEGDIRDDRGSRFPKFQDYHAQYLFNDWGMDILPNGRIFIAKNLAHYQRASSLNAARVDWCKKPGLEQLFNDSQECDDRMHHTAHFEKVAQFYLRFFGNSVASQGEAQALLRDNAKITYPPKAPKMLLDNTREKYGIFHDHETQHVAGFKYHLLEKYQWWVQYNWLRQDDPDATSAWETDGDEEKKAAIDAYCARKKCPWPNCSDMVVGFDVCQREEMHPYYPYELQVWKAVLRVGKNRNPNFGVRFHLGERVYDENGSNFMTLYSHLGCGVEMMKNLMAKGTNVRVGHGNGLAHFPKLYAVNYLLEAVGRNAPPDTLMVNFVTAYRTMAMFLNTIPIECNVSSNSVLVVSPSGTYIPHLVDLYLWFTDRVPTDFHEGVELTKHSRGLLPWPHGLNSLTFANPAYRLDNHAFAYWMRNGMNAVLGTDDASMFPFYPWHRAHNMSWKYVAGMGGGNFFENMNAPGKFTLTGIESDFRTLPPVQLWNEFLIAYVYGLFGYTSPVFTAAVSAWNSINLSFAAPRDMKFVSTLAWSYFNGDNDPGFSEFSMGALLSQALAIGPGVSRLRSENLAGLVNYCRGQLAAISQRADWGLRNL